VLSKGKFFSAFEIFKDLTLSTVLRRLQKRVKRVMGQVQNYFSINFGDIFQVLTNWKIIFGPVEKCRSSSRSTYLFIRMQGICNGSEGVGRLGKVSLENRQWW
jgi:hypothetical protein